MNQTAPSLPLVGPLCCAGLALACEGPAAQGIAKGDLWTRARELDNSDRVEHAPPVPPDPAEIWFALDRIHQLELTVDIASWELLSADPEAEVPAYLWVDGGQVPEIGLKRRGRLGSLQALVKKPKWRLDFNEYVEGRRVFGLEAVAVNNATPDCSLLKEVFAFSIFREAGVAAPRTGWAELHFNRVAYGLHPLVEVTDDRFLKAHFADPHGNLYDGSYELLADGTRFHHDFRPESWNRFELEEGEDVDHEDLWALTEVLVEHLGGPDWTPATELVVDWPQVHRYLAAEMLVGHLDGYALNRNNYRVYFDPHDGRVQLIPWDLDNTFYVDEEWGMSWERPIGILAEGCLLDEPCREAWKAETLSLADRLDGGIAETFIEEQRSVIEAAALADPRQICGVEGLESAWEDLSWRHREVRADIRTFWSLR